MALPLEMTAPSRFRTSLLALIFLAVALWGAVHALGAYRFNHDPRRAFVVAGFVAAFLAGWFGLLLWGRRRRGTRP